MKMKKANSVSLSIDRPKKKFRPGQLVLHIFFWCACILFIYPVLLTVAVSFSSDVSVAADGYKFLYISIVSSRFTSESLTLPKSSLFASLIGFFGCDLIVSGLIGLPFSCTRKSRCGPVESPVEPT